MCPLIFSILEQLIRNWQGTGFSAIQALIDANKQGIPIYQIDANNRSQVLPLLAINDTDVMSDINNALSTGLEVIVPQRASAKAVGVSGIGYILRDPITGAAAYRISGGLNGGAGEAPCAVRELKPLAQAIQDIVLTAIVLAAAAAVLAAVVAGTAGTAAAPVAALMAGVGLSALTFGATAGDLCKPIPLPGHKGGPQGYRSGLCADLVIGNQFPGGDVCVNGVAFDALTADTKLWEVKVIDFTGIVDFVVDSQVTKDFDQRDRQLGALESCLGFNLNWAVADGRHFSRQTERQFPAPLAEHRNVSECFSLPTAP